MKKYIKILIVIVTMLFNSNIYPKSYYADETKVETFLVGQKRFFKFLPEGMIIGENDSIGVEFNVRENKADGKIMWRFSGKGYCSGRAYAGIVEYGVFTNKECYLTFCKNKKAAGIYKSLNECLLKMLPKPIPLESGVEYIIELENRSFKGSLIFVH